MKASELAKKFNEYKNKDAIICAIIWQVEDIAHKANEMGIKITQEQAEDILEKMDSNHDCNYGITWETIEFYLDELK